MDENNRADKKILVKGIKRMGICLMLMFLGPILLHFTLNNSDKSLYIPLLILSIIVCIAAIAMLFIGLNTILDSIFKKEK
ncbi:MAG: hypothetical protein Tsb0033_12070 [Winogradskyella sp.]